MRIFSFIVLFILTGFCIKAQNKIIPVYKNASAPIELRIKDLLSKMTLSDKCKQLDIWHANMDVSKPDTLKKAITDLGDTIKNG
ncbi:MAG: hypothetical protein ABIU77_13465, partial [Ferruginibacter sp.]